MTETPSTTSITSIKEETYKSQPPVEKHADFEAAISATGFGLFNLILLLVTIPAVLASQFETSSLAYVFPVARCDLDISLEDRGFVNASVYAGMIISCFLSGSLIDIFGRRKILVLAHIVEAIFVLITSFSPNFYVLLGAKFLGGFTINGISMALTSYLSEFHGTKYRARVSIIVGLLLSAANIVLPLFAWSVLPLNIKFGLFGGFEFHAWNFFLFLTMFPTLIAGILFFFMPESPKYLMSRGNNEEALKVYQKMFKFNKRQPKEEYPVKSLRDDKQIFHQNSSFIVEAWQQISPLFSLKYARSLTLVSLLQLFIMMCINSLRLWLPEIFQIVNDYEMANGKSISFCQMLSKIKPTSTESDTCSMNFDNASVYINSVYVALCAIVGYITVALFINRLGKKKFLIILQILGAITVGSIYFIPNTSIALAMICLHSMATGISVDTVIAATVDLFPTSLRASAISFSFLFGRTGSVLGNLMLPILLQAGCAPTFFTLGGICIGCTILSIFLPNTERKALG